MNTFKRTAIVFAALLAVCSPAAAQWQAANHSVPLGRGAGVTGFGSAAPGAAGNLFVSNGPNADPSFLSALPRLTINPAPGTTNQGLVINQTAPNTGTQGSSQINYNSINVSDGTNLSGAAFSTALYVSQQLQSNVLGQKAALYVASTRNTAATSTPDDQIGTISFTQASVSNGGTNTGAGAKGSIYASNPIMSALSGAVNYDIFSGGETDVQIFSGATSRRRFGHSLVNANVGTGAELDGALEIASSNTTGSFRNAILLTSFRGGAALATTGSVIGTDGVVATIANGIDLSPYTITGNFLLGPGSKFAVNGAGDLLRLNGHDILLGNGTTTTPYNNILDTAGNGAIVIGGGGSVPDANSYYRNTRHVFGNVGGATSYLTLTSGATGVQFNGYGTGILHSSAAGVLSSSPVVSADMSITPTSCTNQFVTAISAGGVGTCTTDTLASAQHANQGTATTVLHGNAAGNPSFAAVSLTTDVSGTLPVANGGTNYTGGAWTAYTAAITPAAGTITTQVSSSKYFQIGKFVAVNIQVTVSNIGTGSGQITVNLPVASNGAGGLFCAGRESGVSGKMQSGIMSLGSTGMAIFNYDNTVPTFSNGVIFNFNCTYEST